MKVAVIYDTSFGHTEVIAKKIGEGVASQGLEVKLFAAKEINEKPEILDELEGFDGIVFGSPTYMGTVSADFKKFMDSTSKIWYGQKWKDKIAAGFTNSAGLSGDKAHTLSTLCTFACQHSMVWLSQGLFPDGTVNRLGSWVGLMAQSDNASAEITPPESDRAYAVAFGVRIATFMLTKFK
jgi:NAD(P)H dehydrogenase (quinone)